MVCTAIYVKDVGRMLHVGIHTDVNMAFSTEIDHWPVSLQVRMCPPKRKDAPRWDRAAMNDCSLGNEFRFDLRNTLVARAHELYSAGRHFQRLRVLNDTMRGVGSKYFLFWSGPRRQWVSRRAFELMKEAWTAKDDSRDARRRHRHARLFPLFRSWKTILQHHRGSDAQRNPMDAKKELRKSKRNEALCMHFFPRKQLDKKSCL